MSTMTTLGAANRSVVTMTPPGTTNRLMVSNPPMANHSPPTCDRYYFENRTYFLYNGYEGVPETLLINVIGWLALLILFTFLRKIAWDYGRIALVSRTEEKNLLTEGENRYNVWTTLFYGDHDRHSIGSQESLDTTLRMQDKGILAWIPAFFRIKDADILRKCGHDAIQYIQFQRYLLVYLAVVCIISVAVILPVNISDSNSSGSEFGDTTISNVRPESPLLWIHAVFAVVYLLIAVYFMRRFSTNLEYEEDEQVSKTLMVSNIPKDKCFRSVVLQHFTEAYPEAVIIDVQFAYNITKLVSLDSSRQRASEARKMSELMFKKSEVRPGIHPYTCGRCCCCSSCCGCREADAIEYYTEEERLLKEACESEKAQAFQEPLGIAFISFDADHMAARIRADFRASCKGAHNPQISSVYSELNVANWAMKYAPAPENIYWENLSLKEWKWWLRAIILNILLVILLFFFTTPTIIMNSLDELNFQKNLQKSHSAVLVAFLPTILLWTFSALLPNVVYYSDQFVGHWTKTAEHHSVMRKTFIFLLLMVLILPSLGLTSAKALFEWVVIDTTGNRKYRWQCIFLAGNGAFFVNYVITSAFIGSGLELIRFSQLFMYALKLICSRSVAEKSTVRKSVVWDFQFGIQYAWMLCVFTIIMTYSIPCPLVMPFGMVYMGLKHLVDRYNIYFAYAPSKIDKNIHTSAVTFVIAAVIFLQISIVFFSALRTVELRLNPVFIFSAVALFITLVVFFGRIFFGWFKGLSPIKYKNAGSKTGSRSPNEETQPFSDKDTEGTQDKPFVPSVLTESGADDQPPDVSTFTYGSTGSVNMGDGTTESG